jgi:hypothetical protein
MIDDHDDQSADDELAEDEKAGERVCIWALLGV